MDKDVVHTQTHTHTLGILDCQAKNEILLFCSNMDDLENIILKVKYVLGRKRHKMLLYVNLKKTQYLINLFTKNRNRLTRMLETTYEQAPKGKGMGRINYKYEFTNRNTLLI